jgi:hypothetical protein
MNKLKISFLALAVSAAGVAIVTQIKKRGGMKPAFEDLKTGTASAVETVKGKLGTPALTLVKTGDGGSIEGVGSQIGTGADDDNLGDRALARAEG